LGHGNETIEILKRNAVEYLETAKFRLNEGMITEQFIEAGKGVRNGLIGTQPGFISRELGLDETGSWFMDMRFDIKSNMGNWFLTLKQDPAMKTFGSMIDFSTMTTDFFIRQI